MKREEEEEVKEPNERESCFGVSFSQSSCWAGGSPRGEGNGATKEQQTQNLGRHAKNNKNMLCSMICGGGKNPRLLGPVAESHTMISNRGVM